VHRDLKPGNIMVATRKDEEIVKILDFGLVGVVNADGESATTSLTKTGYIMGTPAYMAPEQIGHPTVGPRADLYALGGILYEMISGGPPFSGTPAEVFALKLSQPAPPLEPAGGLERLAQSLLDRAPEKRPQSAAEVITILEGGSAAGPVMEPAGPSATVPLPPPASPPEPTGPPEPPREMIERSLVSMDRDGTLAPSYAHPSVRRRQRTIPYAAAAVALGSIAVAAALLSRQSSPVLEAPLPSTPPAEAPLASSPTEAKQAAPRMEEKDAPAAAAPSVAPPVTVVQPAATPNEPRLAIAAPHSKTSAKHRRSPMDPEKAVARPESHAAPHDPPVVTPPLVAVEPAPAPKSPPPPSSDMGTITVHVKGSAGADVTAAIFVDGRDIGRVSPLVQYPLPSGKHRVEIRVGANARPRSKETTVRPDQNAAVFFVAD
jgi:serine/threonine-protein kinase